MRSSLKKTRKKLFHLVRTSISKIFKPLFVSLSIFSCFTIRKLITQKKIWPEKVKNVLIINQNDMLNKGDAAILTGTLKIINKAFPHAKIVIVSLTYQIDEPRCPFKVIPNYRFLKLQTDFISFVRKVKLLSFILIYRLTSSDEIFHMPILRKAANETLIQYSEADLIVHRGGDNLTEDYGVPYIFYESILIGILLQKPTIILGESIGPFTTYAGKRLTKTILNKVDVIIAREKLSENYLNKLKIFRP